MTRVEYPISANYAKSWTIAQAISELIANMLDESSKNGGRYVCSHDRGKATFRDFGEGFDPSCLMLGEGEEKGEFQIGQFKEGLKLALLVLARSGKKVSVRSSRCIVHKVVFEDTALGKPGMVVYMSEPEEEIKGTEVIVRCSKRDFRKACDQYVTLSVEGEPAPVIPAENTIVIPEELGKGTIAINGRRVGSGHYAFSYSLRGSDVKGAINRDRSVLDLDVALRKVRDLWYACRDEDLIYRLLQWAYSGGRAREFSHYHFYVRSHAVWRSAFARVFGSGKLFWYSGVDDVKKRELERLGYKPVVHSSGKMASFVDRIAQDIFPGEDEMLLRHIRAHSTGDHGVMKVLEFAHIQEDLIENLNWAASLAISICESSGLSSYVRLSDGSKLLKSVDWAVFLENLSDPDSDGSWYADMLWVKSSTLSDRPRLLEVCMHEVAHAVSGCKDNTREFEAALGKMMGAAAMHSRHPTIMYDVTKPAGSRMRSRSMIQMDQRQLTLGRICAIFSQIGGISGDPRAEKTIEKVIALPWRYGGSTGSGLDPVQPGGNASHFFYSPGKRKGLYVVEVAGKTDENLRAPEGWRLTWRIRSPGYVLQYAARRSAAGIDGVSCDPERLIPGFPGEEYNGEKEEENGAGLPGSVLHAMQV